MSAFKFCCIALSLSLAAPAFAKSASRTRLVTLPNPAKAGQAVLLQAEVDGRRGGPSGMVSFSDGAVSLGSAKLARAGAGQATLSGGDKHSCALSAAGGVRCWGKNDYGQLGEGTTTTRLSPIDVAGLGADVVAVTAGVRHSCALTGAGAVKCWGENFSGALGDGTTTDRYEPVPVSGLSSGVVAIAAGSSHTCALTSAGAVKCWGSNSSGQLGDGSGGSVGSRRLRPVDVKGLSTGVVAIGAAFVNSCARTSAGAVKCWGFNGTGQLGDGTTTERHTPVAVSGLSHDVVALAVGGSTNCALTSARGVKCWGHNHHGQIGDGTTTDRTTPVDVSGLSSGVVVISVGGAHTCALTVAGGVKCWGFNEYGEIGDGTTTDRHQPVAVSGLSTGVVAIAAGHLHSCAVTIGGSKCWGHNYSGQLGDGTTTVRLVPTPVLRLMPVVRARARLSTRALGVGTHALQASFPGDASHSPSSASQSQTIVP
jgi:alpha-tubulin suppressor-like RCC1 family protein